MYEVGGWFYEPDDNVVYVIEHILGDISMTIRRITGDFADMGYSYRINLFNRWVETLQIYYIPPTTSKEDFDRKIFEIRLKHKYSNQDEY